ncbi:hypothetical protein EFK50_21430 [Nocardioides marmoriginsengisoli]|uniref:Uncharacterized protein n=1 Tax=Nocardioides marmoriginsengisoli TaxID=661483 RepID=A0A3N0CAF4_9ACTN|nr:hypothetical protein [Nocardioides marmoriginsengisoli]RNL59953.1 hypothetical protein EFK50_21430 [Nocardioides marmoriginsengisoli]
MIRETLLLAWTDAAVSADGRSVSVDYLGGACEESSRTILDEQPASVALTVVVVNSYKSDRPCTAVGITRTISATLRAPLSDRQLTDGRCDHRELGTVVDSATC